MTKKLGNTFKILFMFTIAFAIVFSICLIPNDVSYANDVTEVKPVIKICKDTQYLIYKDDVLLETVPLEDLDNPDEKTKVENQKKVLDNIKLNCPKGFDLILSKDFFNIGFLEAKENNEQEYNQTTSIEIKKLNAFGGFVPTNESYSWYYKIKNSDWKLDGLETTNVYQFGKDYDEILKAGDYFVKCIAKYTMNFGGETLSCKVESNEFEVKIVPTQDYDVDVKPYYEYYYLKMQGNEAVNITLSEIDMSNFTNGNDKWSLSKKEDGNRKLLQGENVVKAVYTPYNTSLAPREFDIKIKGVKKKLSIIVPDVTVLYGDDYELTYTRAYGLMEGDTLENLGIKLFVVDQPNNKLSPDDIKPGHKYYINGELSVDRYIVAFQTQKSYYEDFFPKRAEISFLMDEITQSVFAYGNITFKKNGVFNIGDKVFFRASQVEVPLSLVRDGYQVLESSKVVFTKSVYDPIYGTNTDYEIDSGVVDVSYKNENADIKYIAYLDDEGWHLLDFENSSCAFKANNIQYIVFFGEAKEVLSWVAIFFSSLLGLNIAIMIALLIYKFGRKLL